MGGRLSTWRGFWLADAAHPRYISGNIVLPLFKRSDHGCRNFTGRSKSFSWAIRAAIRPLFVGVLPLAIRKSGGLGYPGSGCEVRTSGQGGAFAESALSRCSETSGLIVLPDQHTQWSRSSEAGGQEGVLPCSHLPMIKYTQHDYF